MHQQPILQLVDNCASDIETFPLYRDFPGQIRTVKITSPTNLVQTELPEKVRRKVAKYLPKGAKERSFFNMTDLR